MSFNVYETPDGKIAVLWNEFCTNSAEYVVASLFRRDGIILFAQLIGTQSPKPYLFNQNVSKVKLDNHNNLYTISNKETFNYKFPLAERALKVIVAPTKTAALDIFNKLLGFEDPQDIAKYFTTSFIKDEGQSKRVALLFTQKHSDKTQLNAGNNLITQFDEMERTPVLYKGGEVGDFSE